ncbi:hypothetical protein PQQ99_19990 [Paraburkholderia sediminicola]|uniref:hypothetical protein n=1 Tax=Paraburkholderia sediminicola TaxID=458836 RepID=UPI0038BC3C38
MRLTKSWLYCVFVQYFAMDTLPQFEPPRYAELREWWKKYRGNPDVIRLILEVQTQRYAFSEMRTMAEFARDQAAEEAPELLDKGKALANLHRRLEQELRRSGRVYPEHKFSDRRSSHEFRPSQESRNRRR